MVSVSCRWRTGDLEAGCRCHESHCCVGRATILNGPVGVGQSCRPGPTGKDRIKRRSCGESEKKNTRDTIRKTKIDRPRPLIGSYALARKRFPGLKAYFSDMLGHSLFSRSPDRSTRTNKGSSEAFRACAAILVALNAWFARGFNSVCGAFLFFVAVPVLLRLFKEFLPFVCGNDIVGCHCVSVLG